MLTVFTLMVMVHVTLLFSKHTLPLLGKTIARWIEQGESDEISKIERGESEAIFKIGVEEELEDAVEPVKGMGQEVTLNDEERLLGSSSRETPEALDTDSLMGTVDLRSATSISDSKPIDEYMLQSLWMQVRKV